MKIRLGTRDADDILRHLEEKAGNWVAKHLPLNSPLGVDFVVKKVKPEHTDFQRGYYWKGINLWGDHVGYSAKESEQWIHYDIVCCETFGVLKTIRHRGQIRQIPKMTSAKLTREDYSKLIDTMLRLAAEDGVVIPEPE